MPFHRSLLTSAILAVLLLGIGRVRAQSDDGFTSHTFAAQAQAVPSSTYTSLDPVTCLAPAMMSRQAAIQADSESICPGVAGYKLLVETDSQRPTVTVIAPTAERQQLSLLAYSQGFSSLGARAEWRMAHNGTNLYPIALIIRLTENTSSGHSGDAQYRYGIVSRLVVAKIGPHESCVVGAVPPSPMQNEIARSMADRAGQMRCESGS